MVASLDGSVIGVQKDAAKIVKMRSVLETMVRVSMAVWMIILDSDVIDMIKVRFVH